MERGGANRIHRIAEYDRDRRNDACGQSKQELKSRTVRLRKSVNSCLNGTAVVASGRWWRWWPAVVASDPAGGGRWTERTSRRNKGTKKMD